MNFFGDFLKKKGLQDFAAKVYNATVMVPCLPWVEPNNKHDCGVYVMRHMETYMGEYGSKWKHGFNLKLKKQLQYLRIKYCAAIATAECNELKDYNIDVADSLYLLVSKEKPLDLEDFLIGFRVGM